MFLATPYHLDASICTNFIADDGPGWPNILVLSFLRNAVKLIIIGPVSVALLIRARF